jgi:two-component system sensor histidine kinase YesM
MKLIRSFFRRTTLFTKLLLFLVIAVSIPVSLLGYLSYNRSIDQIEEVASVFLTDNVNQNAQRVQRLLRETEQRSEAVLASSELQELLATTPPAIISDELEFIRNMNEIITELKGPFELYIFPDDLHRYPNYSNLLQYSQVTPTEEMFIKADELTGRGYWTHEWNARWEAPDFIFVRQIRSLDHFSPVGMMAIRIPAFMIRDELIGPALYAHADLIITDSDGTVLSHPNAGEYGKPSANVYLGEAYMSASLALPAESWRLSILLPKEDLTASLDEVKRFTLWIVIISLVLITLLLFLIARSFTRPIKQIIRFMKKVQLGQLEPLHLQERHDEIGQWINGYNAMIESLLEQMDTIRHMEREKKDLERQMLILQINPHFLYNTLDSIKWKAQAIQEPVISEMVTRLANMLRFSLSDGDGFTTVEREMEHVKNYVDIEQLRNPGHFKVLYHIEPELMGERMLQLLLQPLVENAIRHGMGKKKEHNGKVMISAYLEEPDMVFTIEDNGSDAAVPSKPGGVGLSNVQRRLSLHFGETYKVSIESSEQGFKVKLRHPLTRREH